MLKNVHPANATLLIFALGVLGWLCWPQIMEVYNDPVGVLVGNLLYG